MSDQWSRKGKNKESIPSLVFCREPTNSTLIGNHECMRFLSTEPTLKLTWERTLFTSKDQSFIHILTWPGLASPMADSYSGTLFWLATQSAGTLLLKTLLLGAGRPSPPKHYSSSSSIISFSTLWLASIHNCLGYFLRLGSGHFFFFLMFEFRER